MRRAKEGVWATMLTPFTDRGEVDYPGLEHLIEWYAEHRVTGLFAICKSSESFEMTLEERLSVSKFIVRRSAGRMPVIAGATYSTAVDEQARELERMAGTGVDAVVIIASMIAGPDASDGQWRNRLEKLVDSTGTDMPLGIYESPAPYHRLITPVNLDWCRRTGRFRFLKDTCCDIDLIRRKLAVIEGSDLRLFNANTDTLLDSLRHGAAGYSSVMANVNPELYDWLIRNHEISPDRAARLESFLSVANEAAVARCYPTSAKYFLTLQGLPISLYTRTKTRLPPDDRMRRVINHLHRINQDYLDEYET